MRKSLIFILFFVGKILLAQPQSFKSIVLPDDIVINTIAQDENGMLWLGSTNGVFIYDGFDFKSINGSLSKNVLCILKDNNSMWLGCQSGELFNIDIKNTEIINLKSSLKFPIRDIIKIKNEVVIATYGDGVFVLKNNQLTSLEHLSSKEIYDVEQLNTEYVAVASDLGIDIINIKKPLDFKSLKNLPDNIIKSLCKHGHTLYAASHDKSIFSIDLNNERNTIIDENKDGEKVEKILLVGNKLICQYDDKIVEWQDKNKTVLYKSTDNEKVDNLTNCFVDNENNLWVTKGKHSLLHTNLHLVNFESNLKNETQSMAFNNGKFYFGTSKGMYIKDNLQSKNSRHILENENITVLKYHKDKIWIGTFSNGLYLFDTKNEKIVQVGKLQNISDNTILDLEIIDDDNMQIATLAGVKSLQLCNFTNIKNVINTYVYDIFKDSKKNIWYGKDRNGIVKINSKDTLEVKSIINSFDNKPYKIGSVYSIVEHDETIYFATTLAGLVFFKNNKWSVMPNTLFPNDAITSLIVKNNNLLLVRATKTDVVNLKSNSISSFKSESNSNNSLYLNNYCFDEHDIYYGSNTGFTRFTENEFTKNYPNVSIQKIEVNLEKVLNGANTFDEDENNFRFTFAAGWLQNPSAVKFMYKLDGFDTEWRKTTDRVVSYPKLGHGKYTFKINASDSDIFVEKNHFSYSFEIKQSFHNTWWFYLLLLTISGFVLYAFLQRRKKTEHEKSELSKKIIESELINLKSQLDPHFLFNTFNTLIGLIEEDPKRGVKFTENLTRFFRKISEIGDKKLVLLDEELYLLKKYKAILEERFGANLVVEIDREIDKLTQTYIPPMCLQMLIENAVKHNEVSRANPLVININKSGDYISVANKKNPKIANSQLSLGIGNKNIIERYKLLHQLEPYIEDLNNTYTFFLPIIKNTYHDINNS